MSGVDPENFQTPLSVAIERNFASIMSLNLQIAKIMVERDATIQEVRERIKTEEVPKRLRFIAHELMSPTVYKQHPELIQKRIEFWAGLDNEIRAHAGETIAWLEPEEATVGHSFTEGAITEFEYYVALGVLPADAKLEDDDILHYKIPVETAVRTRFFYNLDEELAWDMGLGSTFHFVGEPEFMRNPEILPIEDGILAHNALSFPRKINIPLPIVGNEAVAAILEEHSLADLPEIEQAARMLKDSIS